MASFQLTGECFVGAASNGKQVLDDMLTVGGLATAALAQQDNGLILTSGQQAPVSSLGHAVNMRGSVLPPAAFEHLHHLEGRQRGVKEGRKEDRVTSITIFTLIRILLFHNRCVIICTGCSLPSLSTLKGR